MRFRSAKCTSSTRLDGKTAIVTGSNTGIGKLTVQDFYKRGAHVIMACRDLRKAQQAAEDIKNTCKDDQDLGDILILQLDLSNLESIRAFTKMILENEGRVDLLINNAGVMMCPKSKTVDGFETQFGTNHLGHFLLTMLLMPKIIESAPARIVNVASVGHKLLIGPLVLDDLNWEKRRYSAIQAYWQSKLANVLFTKELARRLEGANVVGVNTYTLHPGIISTELARHFKTTFCRVTSWAWNDLLRLFWKTPEQGAQTTIHCAVDENAGNESGLYYEECKVKDSSSKSKDVEVAKRLWDISWKMVRLGDNYNPFSPLEINVTS